MHPEWYTSQGYGELPEELKKRFQSMDCHVERVLTLSRRTLAAKEKEPRTLVAKEKEPRIDKLAFIYCVVLCRFESHFMFHSNWRKLSVRRCAF